MKQYKTPRESLFELADELKAFGDSVDLGIKSTIPSLEGRSAAAVLNPFLQLIEVCRTAPERLKEKIDLLDHTINRTAAEGKERMKKASFQIPAEQYDKILSKYVDKYLPSKAAAQFKDGKANLSLQDSKGRQEYLKEVLLSLTGILLGVGPVNHLFVYLKEALQALWSAKSAKQAATRRSRSIYEQLKAFDEYQEAIRTMCVFIYLVPSPSEIDNPPDLSEGMSRLNIDISAVVLANAS